ncbi:MAG: hypothetical protein SFV23_15605 [Planctomycetaceae bacterium]|nr:hypothetical protein [Planctomycetaceae bacterium]
MLRLMRATLWTTVLCGCGTERAPLPELPKRERPLPDAVELLKPGVIADGKIVVQSLTGEPIEEIPLTTEFLARFSFRLVEPPPGGLKRIRVQLITYNSRHEPLIAWESVGPPISDGNQRYHYDAQLRSPPHLGEFFVRATFNDGHALEERSLQLIDSSASQ